MSTPYCLGPPTVEGPALRRYRGPAGRERLVRVQQTNGEVWHYKGPKGRERLVKRTQCVDSDTEEPPVGPVGGWTVQYYSGPVNHERLRCSHDRVTGTFTHFEGPAGYERTVRTVDSDGGISYYEGDFLHERCVRYVRADGHEYEYEGDERDGGAWLERHTYPSGQVDHHHPDYGIIERTVWPDGTIDHFQFCYASRTHRVLVTEQPNGQVRYYSTPVFQRHEWWMPGGWCKGGASIWLRDGRILGGAALRWVQVRRWVAARAIALHWQERTQVRLAAPGGAGRAADLAAFEADFGALCV